MPSGPRKEGAREPIAARLLRRLAGWVYEYPRCFFYPQALLFFLSVGYTVNELEFTTERNALVGADKQYHRNFLQYRREFQSEPDLVAVIESEDLEKNRQFVERLGARLEAETHLFTDVLYNTDVKMLGNKALLFFPEPELVEFQKALEDYRPFLLQFAQATNLNELFRMINREFRDAAARTNQEAATLVKALPALERIVVLAADSVRRPGTPPSLSLAALFDASAEAERRIHITFDNGRLYLVTAQARDGAVEARAVVRFRELVSATRLEVPGVNAGITGQPVLEFDEMAQCQRDTTLASVVSLGLVALIFIYGYQETGRPIKATVCLMVGLAYTLGFATLAIGHLNILTITFVPMLVGLAIDFGVHLITRYEEELRRGRSERQALEEALVHTGQGIFTGCFTTAGAFLAMGLTDFKGIQEMGIICGGGLLICLVPMLTLLPVLLLRGRQNVLDHRPTLSGAEGWHRIERLWLERPALVLLLAAALCAWAYPRAKGVGFDYNLLRLQTRGLAAVELEHKLIESADQSVLHGVVITRSLEEARRLEAVIESLPSVAAVKSMSQFLTEDQVRKLELVGNIKRAVADLAFPELDPRLVDLKELSATLWRLQGYLGLGAKEAEEGDEPEIATQLRSLRGSIQTLRQVMLAGDRSTAAARLAHFQQALFGDLRETFEAIRDQDDSGRLRIEDLPPALRHRFVNREGTRHLIQVYPKEDVWQRENQEQFVGALREALDPSGAGEPVITGAPVQLLEYTTLLKESYEEAAGYALGAIAILVFVHFRSLVCVLLALTPVGLGAWWMLGVMGQRGIDFNPANIMTLPLVIGIGVTSGIHILNRFKEEQSPSLLGKSTGKAVLISGLTTIVGFGSLLLAKHQGIASLGAVMALGTGTCMLAALTAVPALLRLLGLCRWRMKKPSDEGVPSALGREEPR